MFTFLKSVVESTFRCGGQCVSPGFLKSLEKVMNTWIEQMFDARAAQTGGLIRRSIAWVRRLGLEAELFAAVKRRGFRLYESETQYVILCRRDITEIVLAF